MIFSEALAGNNLKEMRGIVVWRYMFYSVILLYQKTINISITKLESYYKLIVYSNVNMIIDTRIYSILANF